MISPGGVGSGHGPARLACPPRSHDRLLLDRRHALPALQALLALLALPALPALPPRTPFMPWTPCGHPATLDAFHALDALLALRTPCDLPHGVHLHPYPSPPPPLPQPPQAPSPPTVRVGSTLCPQTRLPLPPPSALYCYTLLSPHSTVTLSCCTGAPLTADDFGITGALCVLLMDALMPTTMQVVVFTTHFSLLTPHHVTTHHVTPHHVTTNAHPHARALCNALL